MRYAVLFDASDRLWTCLKYCFVTVVAGILVVMKSVCHTSVRSWSFRDWRISNQWRRKLWECFNASLYRYNKLTLHCWKWSLNFNSIPSQLIENLDGYRWIWILPFGFKCLRNKAIFQFFRPVALKHCVANLVTPGYFHLFLSLDVAVIANKGPSVYN